MFTCQDRHKDLCLIMMGSDYSSNQENIAKINRRSCRCRKTEMGKVWTGERQQTRTRSSNNHRRRERYLETKCRSQSAHFSPFFFPQKNIFLSTIEKRYRKLNNRLKKEPKPESKYLVQELSVADSVKGNITLQSVHTKTLLETLKTPVLQFFSF